jgi:hypothetical protein
MRTNTEKRKKISLILILALVLTQFMGVMPVSAAAPTGTSAVIYGNDAYSVYVAIYGTNFDAFVSNNSKTAGYADLWKISYNGQYPTSATIDSINRITAVFPIAVGTGNSGGTLIINAGAVKDAGGSQNAVITITAANITDTVKPQLVGATVYGTTLALNYTESLDSTSKPLPVNYVVYAGTTIKSVTDVNISGTTVTLTLTSAVVYGQSVTVKYNVPVTDR